MWRKQEGGLNGGMALICVLAVCNSGDIACGIMTTNMAASNDVLIMALLWPCVAVYDVKMTAICMAMAYGYNELVL